MAMTIEPSTPSASPESGPPDDVDIKPPGRLRQSAGLLLAVVAALALGPSITRVISSYRAIVLEVRDDQMHVAWEDNRPNDWVAAVDAQAGDMVEKQAWTWRPRVVERRPTDHPLIQLYERYSRTYTGTILKISPPRGLGDVGTALVQIDGGGRVAVPLYNQLRVAEVGMRVQKRPSTWDPVLLEEPPKPVTFQKGEAPSGTSESGSPP